MSRPKTLDYLRPKADPSLARTFCFSVQAEADPGVMPRVLGLFAKRGLVPQRFYVDHLPREGLVIDIQSSALEPRLAERLAEEMRGIWGAQRVLLCEKARRLD